MVARLSTACSRRKVLLDSSLLLRLRESPPILKKSADYEPRSPVTWWAFSKRYCSVDRMVGHALSIIGMYECITLCSMPSAFCLNLCSEPAMTTWWKKERRDYSATSQRTYLSNQKIGPSSDLYSPTYTSSDWKASSPRVITLAWMLNHAQC